MKRDLDLCREILRQIGDSPNLNATVEVAVEGRSEDEITYQLHIMRQAGLIEAVDASSMDGTVYLDPRLTWKGNEFLDATSNNTVLNKAKEKLAQAGGAFTFDLLLAACKAVIRDRTGLDL
jgi:hypothetical protein